MEENKEKNIGRVIGLDIGKVRVGAAISDEGRRIARGLGVWKRENFSDELERAINEYKISIIVLGLPKRTDGKKSEAEEDVKIIAEDLKIKFPECEIDMFDERFTTVIAQRVLIGAGVSRKVRKSRVDELAAVLILESWLEAQRRK